MNAVIALLLGQSGKQLLSYGITPTDRPLPTTSVSSKRMQLATQPAMFRGARGNLHSGTVAVKARIRYLRQKAQFGKHAKGNIPNHAVLRAKSHPRRISQAGKAYSAPGITDRQPGQVANGSTRHGVGGHRRQERLGKRGSCAAAPLP